MKRAILILALLLQCGSASALTNLSARLSEPVMVNSNAVITFPTNFFNANDIARGTSVSNLSGLVETNNQQADLSISNLWGFASNSLLGASSKLQATGAVSWVYTQSWDFSTASHTSEWSALDINWFTNQGWSYSAGSQKLTWTGVQSNDVYQVTWTETAASGSGNLYFDPVSYAYSSTNLGRTNTVLFTNASIQIALSSPTQTFETVNLTYVSISGGDRDDNSLFFDGNLLPMRSNAWELGSSDKPLETVFTKGISLDGQTTTGRILNVSSTAPTSSVDTARPYTLAVDPANVTNAFFCLTNDWLGAGTNWLRWSVERF